MKTLKKFDFVESASAIKAIYDWAKLLDGGIYQMEEGKDYQCKTTTFSTLARNQGRKAGKAVKINAVDGGLVIQAADASKEQKAAWAKADAAAKARKAAGEESSEETEE